MDKKTIEKVDLKSKRVFIRADFNVPLDENGNITDDGRIRSTLPTINYALDGGAKVILASHLGRPKGKPDPKYSLAPVALRLNRLLNKEVKFAKDCIGPDVEHMIAGMRPGDVLLLENLRFHAEEEKNDGHRWGARRDVRDRARGEHSRRDLASQSLGPAQLGPHAARALAHRLGARRRHRRHGRSV